MIDSSSLTFDLQLQRVGQVPLRVGHVTFVHSWDISCDGGQRQGTIEHLKRGGGKEEEDQRRRERLEEDHGAVIENEEVFFKRASKLLLLQEMLIKIFS